MVAIAVLDDYQQVALKMADWSHIQAGHQVTVFSKPFASEDEAQKALAGFEVICLMRERTPFGQSLIDRLPKLKLIVTTAMRNASIDVKAAAARNILVCGTDGGNHATAELTMGLMIMLARHLAVEAQGMRDGKWQTTVGNDLRNKTVGIIGLGRLGSLVAKFASAFGMKIIAWSQNLTPEAARAGGAERVDKDELFRRADFITIHTRLSDRTRGLVGTREFSLMRPTAYIINTSRGPIIDGPALLEALDAGRIAGAGLDVYDVEPLPTDHPLRRNPRVILTPHLGYVTEETYRLFYPGTVESIEAWLAGAPIRVIDP